MTKEEILAMGFPKLKDAIWEAFDLWVVDEKDISGAWQVWLAVTEDAPEDWAIYSDSNGEVTVEHYPDKYMGDREMSCGDFSVDGLFPEAMCKAALLSKLEVGDA